MSMMKVLVLAAFAVVIVSCEDVATNSVDPVDELSIVTLSAADSCDRKTKKGDMLSMHYEGSLLDGSIFDSSFTRDEPFKFQLGVGQVIKGWDQGLTGMCKGEKRKLVIPAALGYGEHGAGDKIPGGATLQFIVECVDIEDGPAPVNVFDDIDQNKDKQLSREEVSDYLKKQLPEAAGSGVHDLPEQDKLVEEIFQHEDMDKNGFISHEEFSGPKHDEL